MSIGEKIKLYRERKKLTQEQLGNLIGVKGATITRYEKGDRQPKIEQFSKLAEALGCLPVDLLDDDTSTLEKWNVEYNAPQLKEDVLILEIMEKFNILNDLGKAKAKDYIDDLAEQDKYINKEGE